MFQVLFAGHEASILSQEELDQLAAAIGQAEAKTSGEIRLMIVKRSARVGHVAAVLWLLLVCLSLLGLWYQRHIIWLQDRPLLINEPWWFIPAVLLACAVFAHFGAKVPAIQRLLLTPKDMQDAVWTRAELEFHREGLSHTQGSTGILLFLSLFERKAVALADRGIASHVKPELWSQVIGLILEGPKTGQWKAKLEEAIRLCGKVLAEHLPATSHEVNELPNAVILKD